MRIGILGSGLMGGTLGTVFARAGHEVVFSYARSDRKLKRLALAAGHGARAASPAEAAHGVDAVLLAVHWLRVGDVLRQAGSLEGKVVVSCVMPMDAENTRLVVGHTTSGAETLAKRLKGSRFACAFGTVPSEVLFSVFERARARVKLERRRTAVRPSLLYCGDDLRAKAVAARLIADAGFEPLDAGPLKMARHLEPFTLLVAQLAYEGPRGPRMAYRFEWTGK